MKGGMRYMNNIALSQEETQIILGGLLGDATLINNSIRFLQSTKQEEYIQWKHSKLNPYNTSDIHLYNINEKYSNLSFYFNNRNKQYTNFYNKIRKIFIKNNKKYVSMDYLLQLDNLGLAVWWMDDGCLSIHKGNRYGKLCTHSFSYNENMIIKQYFKDKWDIDIAIKIEHKKYYFCYFNTCNLKKLIKIIYPYVTQVKSMIYKIDLNYKNDNYLGDFKDIYYYIKSVS